MHIHSTYYHAYILPYMHAYIPPYLHTLHRTRRAEFVTLRTLHYIRHYITLHYIRPYFLFLCSGGYVLVNCAPAPGGSSFHLVIDYLTDAVLKKSEIGGRLSLSPDARHLVVVANQTLSAYTITADVIVFSVLYCIMV